MLGLLRQGWFIRHVLKHIEIAPIDYWFPEPINEGSVEGLMNAIEAGRLTMGLRIRF